MPAQSGREGESARACHEVSGGARADGGWELALSVTRTASGTCEIREWEREVTFGRR